jgi:hypothetical protein
MGLRMLPERHAAAGLCSGLHRATDSGCGPGCGTRGGLAVEYRATMESCSNTFQVDIPNVVIARA